MARFILDIANLEENKVKAICEFVCDALLNAEDSAKNSGIITINCIDKTNDNQFHNEFEDGETNELSVTQIENFKKVCNE
jgi:hypothetical protein